MNAKITVPSNVSTAIAHFVRLADSKHEAFTDILRLGYETEQSEIILRHFDGDYDVLMEALICGYEVEKSPEEKLVEYFKACGSQPVCESCYQSEYRAIKKTLYLLGITIAGINGGEA